MFRSRSWRRLAVVGLFAGTLGACGGGGGDDGSVAPAVPIADSAALWWNAEPAARWTFDVTDARPAYPAKRVNLVTVDGTVTVDGKTFTRFAHSSSIADAQPDEELRYFDGSSVFVAGDVSLDPTVPLIGSYAELPAPLVAGVTTTVLDESEDFDVDGDGRLDFRLRLLVTVLLGTEANRSVPAGSFSNVLWARTTATATVTELTLNQSESATSIQTVWYAPGVGPIRRELIDPDPSLDASNNFVVEELSGVSVAAVKAGTVPGHIALDSIGGGASSDFAGVPALASDGNRVLVVSRALAEPSIERLVAAILAPDGSALWRGTVIDQVGVDMVTGGAYTAAAFDGQNFQVFWMAPTSGAQLVGRRIAPDGTLLGDPAGTPVGTGNGLIGRVAAASNGTGVLVVWQRYDDARQAYVTEGRTVDRNGAGVSSVFDLGAGEADISVAWSGGRYLVAKASPAGGPVAVVRVGEDGVLLDATWQEVPGSGPFATDPRVTAHPDGFLLGWSSWASSPGAGTNLLLSRRINGEGVLLDADDVVIDGTPTSGRFGFALTGGNSGLLAGWVKNLTLDPNDSAERAKASSAPWAPGAPVFDAPASLWYTTPNIAPPRDAFPVAVAASSHFVMAWLENVESGVAFSDRVVATFVYPQAAR